MKNVCRIRNQVIIALLTIVTTIGNEAISAEEVPLVVPAPKNMTRGNWSVILSAADAPRAWIAIPPEHPKLRIAADEINKAIIAFDGAPLPVKIGCKEAGEGFALFIANSLNGGLFAGKVSAGAIVIPESKRATQSYVIRWTDNAVLLAGADDQGALYAAVTLCHMLRKSAAGVEGYRANVDDWPDFLWRGDAHLGGAMCTRGYLYNAKRLGVDKSYPALLEDYVDACLHLKLNHMYIFPKNLVYRKEDYSDRITAYCKARGFRVYTKIYAAFFGGKKADPKQVKAYQAKTGCTDKDFMIHLRQRYWCWSKEDLIRETFRKHLRKGIGVYYHCPDTGDENWGKRCDQCRKKYGNNRAAADAFVLNILKEELDRLNPDEPDLPLYAVIQPYHALYLDRRFYKYADEYVDHYRRLDARVSDRVAFCVRESERDSLAIWLRTVKNNPILLYHEHRWFCGATQILASNIRFAKTYYFPEHDKDVIYSLRCGGDLALDLPLGAVYSWNTEAPGAAFLSLGNKYDFDAAGRTDPAFTNKIMPRTVRFVWGEEAGRIMAAVYASRLNILLTLQPLAAQRAANKITFWKKKKLLPRMDPEMFAFQERAADRVCKLCRNFFERKTPIRRGFLRGTVSRLYKNASAVRALAPVWQHYFAADKAVADRNPEKAAREIALARKANERVDRAVADAKETVKDWPQDSGSYLQSSLRRLKPFKLATSTLAKFRVPTREEMNRTSVNDRVFREIQERTIKAVPVAKPPVIDGNPNEACWTTHPYPVNRFVRYPYSGSPKLAVDQTEVRVCYDAKNLYVAFRAWDMDADSLLGKDHPRDDEKIFREDIVEIFLNPKPDSESFAQFVLNTAGSRFDVFCKKQGGARSLFSNDWNPEWTVATMLRNDGWTAEVAIPFSIFTKEGPARMLERAPKAGDRWRINMAREKRTLELSCIRYMKDAGFTSAELFPVLEFLPAGGAKEKTLQGIVPKIPAEPRDNPVFSCAFESAEEVTANPG